MIKRRDQTASSLAFIDVMACGLGAVLLLFVLLDFEQGVATPEPMISDVTDDTAYYEVLAENEEIQQQISTVTAEVEDIKGAIADTIIETITARASIPKPAVQPAVERLETVDTSTAGQGDLIGLQVEGERILIMLDISASMSEERLIDVLVGNADPTGSLLSMGQKWVRAKKIVDWLLDAGPPSSRYQLVVYSDDASLLTQNWLSAPELKSRTPDLLADISPKGATNLELALNLVSDRLGNYNSIYVITDGLPTKASTTTRLLNTNSCGVMSVTRSVPNVTGKCREALFEDSIKGFIGIGRKINIILLPFEGDPMAGPLYWSWAASNQGTLFSPDQFWP